MLEIHGTKKNSTVTRYYVYCIIIYFYCIKRKTISENFNVITFFNFQFYTYKPLVNKKGRDVV